MRTRMAKKRKNPRLRDSSLPHHAGRAVKCQLRKKGIIREKTKGKEERNSFSPSRKAIFFICTQNRALCFYLVAGQALLQLQLLLADSGNFSSAQQSCGPNPQLFLQHCQKVPAWHKMPQWEVLPLPSWFSQPRCVPVDTSTACCCLDDHTCLEQFTSLPKPRCEQTRAQEASFFIPTLNINSARKSKVYKKSNAGSVNTKST